MKAGRKILPAFLLQIDCRIHAVYVSLVKLLAQQLNGFPEALEMDDLPLPEELDHIVYIWVVRKTKNIVIGYPSLLLWYIV